MSIHTPSLVSLTVAVILSLSTVVTTALAAADSASPSDGIAAASASSVPADSLRAAQSSDADVLQDAQSSMRPIMPSYRTGNTLDLDLTPSRFNQISDPRMGN